MVVIPGLFSDFNKMLRLFLVVANDMFNKSLCIVKCCGSSPEFCCIRLVRVIFLLDIRHGVKYFEMYLDTNTLEGFKYIGVFFKYFSFSGYITIKYYR